MSPRTPEKRGLQADMVNTIVFHAEADGAAAAQIATMLSARRKPLTYCVTNDNAAATAQLRMGAHMIALGLLGPHLDANAMRRVLAPVLNGRRRALLLMPGANPPEDVVAAAPSVALHGEHSADSALIENIERYASAIPQRARGAIARTPVLELATGSQRWTPSPLPDLPPQTPEEFEDAAAEATDRPKRFPVVTILLCAAATASLGFFAWRTYEMQRAEPPPRSPFTTPIETPAPLPATTPERAAPGEVAAPADADVNSTAVEAALTTAVEATSANTAPPARGAAGGAPNDSGARREPTQPTAEEVAAPVDQSPEIRGREAQGPER